MRRRSVTKFSRPRAATPRAETRGAPVAGAIIASALIASAVIAGVTPRAASAQSFLGFRALGVPVEAVGGRATSLGNLGIGLPLVAVSPTDPAAAARLAAPTITASMQPSWGDFAMGDQSGTSRTTGFPFIAIGYPVGATGGVATVSVAGHMQQRWAGERTEDIRLGGLDVPINDRFETDGGTSVARFGFAQPFGERIALGVSVGTYVGRLNQSFDRTLDSLIVGTDVQPYSEEYLWDYGGYTLAAGIALDPHDLVHIAGAIEWSTDLKESPRGETVGAVNSYGIPLRLSAGATGQLTQRLLINTSFVYQDWSGAGGFASGVLSGNKMSYGVGIEWRAIQQESRSVPFRVGYRSGAPPFRFDAQDPSESVWTAGIGLNLVELDGLPLGWVDLAVERGSRTSLPLDENFWRGTISIGISQF